MVLAIENAKQGELEELWRFYEEVCAAQEGSAFSPGWHIGIYPNREELSERIAAGEMLLVRCEGRVAAAAVLSGRDEQTYDGAAWLHEAEAAEVCVLHLFAVHPDFRGKGVSDAALEALIRRASLLGRRLLRLDVVKGNLPAERLYQKHGFAFCEEREVWYEDTGEITVHLYERVLG